ncbi:MAG: acylneuraminate cytidylyltransferase family protein [Candidatus Omnitrophica bacterium]|nr:acylneuraminate cytidylyltransferase family protein [Candidatus Omnitrophota bacterium]
MKRVCTVCARGGSKGLPNKNLRPLMGKPLIAYSLIQAKASQLFDKIAVSSDSDEILDLAGKWGADYLVHRPKELATDEAPKLPVIRHCFSETERLSGEIFETAVDLDATSPLRHVEDIRASVRLLEEKKVSNVLTGSPARHSPYFNLVETDERGTVRLIKSWPAAIVRRQDSPVCYDMNASVYVWTRRALLDKPTLFNADTLLYVMPAERSWDIDSDLDFKIVSFLMREAADR